MGRAEEVQQQRNNNNNKRLLPKSNMRSVHCFICFCDDGSVQQDVIVFAILKEFVSLSTGRSVFKAGWISAGSSFGLSWAPG